MYKKYKKKYSTNTDNFNKFEELEIKIRANIEKLKSLPSTDPINEMINESNSILFSISRILNLQQGGNYTYNFIHNKKNYKRIIHTGQRGGKYVIFKKNKKYIKKN